MFFDGFRYLCMFLGLLFAIFVKWVFVTELLLKCCSLSVVIMKGFGCPWMFPISWALCCYGLPLSCLEFIEYFWVVELFLKICLFTLVNINHVGWKLHVIIKCFSFTACTQMSQGGLRVFSMYIIRYNLICYKVIKVGRKHCEMQGKLTVQH